MKRSVMNYIDLLGGTKAFACVVPVPFSSAAPPVTLFINLQADANSLKNFLSAARLADRGSDTSSLPLSTLTPVRARDVEQPKKKLTIVSKKDYPLTSNFPYSLEQLQVSYCKLSRVDMRMLSLKGRELGVFGYMLKTRYSLSF